MSSWNGLLLTFLMVRLLNRPVSLKNKNCKQKLGSRQLCAQLFKEIYIRNFLDLALTPILFLFKIRTGLIKIKLAGRLTDWYILIWGVRVGNIYRMIWRSSWKFLLSVILNWWKSSKFNTIVRFWDSGYRTDE